MECVPLYVAYGKNAASLFTIATEEKVWIIDLIALKNHTELLFTELLEKVLANPSIEKIGLGIQGDFKELQAYFGYDEEDSPVIIAHRCLEMTTTFKSAYSSTKCSLEFIVNTVLERALCKDEQTSDWNHRPLRKAQIHYASLDAVVLLHITKMLSLPDSELSIHFEDIPIFTS